MGIGARLVVAFAIASGAGAIRAQAPDATRIPAEDFARHAEVTMPRLSPDGAYLAVRMQDTGGESYMLVVYRLQDMSVASILRMPKYELPVDVVWVSPTRLVVAKGRTFGSLGLPESTGELLATDVDGKNQEYLYGYRETGRRAATRQNEYGTGEVAGLPEQPNGHFYMSAQPWDSEKSSYLYEVDSVGNFRHLLADIDQYGMDFLVSPDGKPVFAYGINADFRFMAFRRKGDDWSPLDLGDPGATFQPLVYTPDHRKIYALWSDHGEPDSLISMDEETGNRQVLTSDGFASIGHIQWTAWPYQPFGVTILSGIPKTKILQPELLAAQVHARLEQAFPNEFVDFIDFSKDGGKLLFMVSSDRDPGTYYLLDTKTFKANKLFAPQSWIQPERMSERRPIRFKADDGLELDGFLTFPHGLGEQNLPMVLMPHGGPHGISDTWFYDDEAQFLASRGYLVLQVNYRGSGARGVDFQRAGYLKWGTRIQQDLIDGVNWTVAGKYADPTRICVYGGSFGGYSAMMTAIRAPDLFKCAIGYAGIYDLSMMYHKGDIGDSRSGSNYLKAVIGSEESDLSANSPDKLAARIKIPVLLIHGTEDQRAPYSQAQAMKDALEKAGNPPQWLAKSGEGHGFYTEQDNVERLNAIETFLGKCIGAGSAPAATAKGN